MSILSGDTFENLTPDVLLENDWEYVHNYKCYLKVLYNINACNLNDADTIYSTSNNGVMGKPIGKLFYMDFVTLSYPRAIVMCIKRIHNTLEDEYRFRWMMWLEDPMNINTTVDDLFPSNTARSNDMIRIITDVGELQAQQMDWADKVKTEYNVPKECILPGVTHLYSLYWIFK